MIINQIFVGIPFCIIGHYSLRWRGYEWGKLPTFQWVLLELSICILIEELVFYYSHRLLHNPRIYKYIHKKHHEWTAPIAITAIYCHPIEHIFSNLLPPLLGISSFYSFITFNTTIIDNCLSNRSSHIGITYGYRLAMVYISYSVDT